MFNQQQVADTTMKQKLFIIAAILVCLTLVLCFFAPGESFGASVFWSCKKIIAGICTLLEVILSVFVFWYAVYIASIFLQAGLVVFITIAFPVPLLSWYVFKTNIYEAVNDRFRSVRFFLKYELDGEPYNAMAEISLIVAVIVSSLFLLLWPQVLWLWSW